MMLIYFLSVTHVRSPDARPCQ